MSTTEYKFAAVNWRAVHLTGDFAIKVPGDRCAVEHSLCLNRWENEMWTVWRPQFKWDYLCPIVWCEPTGRILVMQRGISNATQAEIEAIYDRYYQAWDAN